MDTATFESSRVYDALLRTLTSVCPDSGLAGRQKWEVRGAPVPSLGPAEEQFDRFVHGYSHRLIKLLNGTTRRDYSASVTAALDAHPPAAAPQNAEESLPPLLTHFLARVAPMLLATKARLRALSATEIGTLTQVVDVMLTLGDGTSEDSAERRHWLYGAGRQFAETLEAKGFACQGRQTELGDQAATDTKPTSAQYALAA